MLMAMAMSLAHEQRLLRARSAIKAAQERLDLRHNSCGVNEKLKGRDGRRQSSLSDRRVLWLLAWKSNAHR